MSALRFRTHDLRALASTALHKAGLVEEEAALVAEILIDAEERGYDSQGVMRLPQYLGWAKAGEYRSPAVITVTRDAPSAIAVDGGHGWGHPVTVSVMRMCIERARKTGSCIGVASNAGHIGRLGYYVERAAEDEGIISILCCAGSISSPVMAPWGGLEARLSTNPIAFGFPYPGGAPVVVDVSTTQAAGGKVALATTTGRSIPDSWAFDAQGNPTTDPALARPPNGTMAPLGGHKGYALAVAVELLSAALAGDYPNAEDGMFIAAIDPAAVTTPEVFGRAVAALDSSVRSSAPRPGFDAPVLPGTGSAARRQRSRDNGVEVPAEVWQKVVEATAGLGLKAPDSM
ncbi:MAG TPA: Ldh family oxidoreductase [Candidatus Dormibacteraeota bacterium]